MGQQLTHDTVVYPEVPLVQTLNPKRKITLVFFTSLAVMMLSLQVCSPQQWRSPECMRQQSCSDHS